MCEPVTILMAAGTVMSAMSAYQQSENQQTQLNFQAQAAERDATSAEAQARRAAERGDAEQQKVGQQQADIRGKQLAATAANGVDISFGSAAGSVEQTDYYGLSDQMTAARNGQDEDYALRNRADQLRTKGSFDRSQADSINPWMSAGGTLLSGAGKVAGQWYNTTPTGSTGGVRRGM